MYSSVYDGIQFVEGRPENASILGPISIKLGGILRSAQLKSLDDVKRIMAAKVRAKGGDAVVDFRYGQRSVGYFSSIFQRDDVNWYGTGQIAKLS